MNDFTYEYRAELFRKAYPKISWQKKTDNSDPMLLSEPIDEVDAKEILQQFRQRSGHNPDSFAIAASSKPHMSCISVDLDTINEQFLHDVISRKNQAYKKGSTAAMFKQKGFPNEIGELISGHIDEKAGRNVGMTNRAARHGGKQKEEEQEIIRPRIAKG